MMDVKLPSRAVALIALTLSLPACGSDKKKSSAEEACITLTEQTCDAMAKCEVSAGNLASSDEKNFASQCTTKTLQVIACGNAKSVADSFQACLDDLPRTDCDLLLANDSSSLPASCHGVILF